MPELIDDLTLAILDRVEGRSAVIVAGAAACGVAVVTGDISIISVPTSSNSGSEIGGGRDVGGGRYRWRAEDARLGEEPPRAEGEVERNRREGRKRMLCIRLLPGDEGEADDVGVLGSKRLPNRVKWSIWFRSLLLLRRTPIVASSGPLAVVMTLFRFPGTF